MGKSAVGPMIKLVLFSSMIIVLSVVIVQAIRAPIKGPQSTFHAMFSDVSGLYEGDSVRLAGVAVGKVTGVDLNGAQAKVTMKIQKERAVTTTTQAAVRYQNLVGQKYLELLPADRATKDPGSPMRPGSTIPVQRTIAAFDITNLFNGVAPLFTEFDPKEFNTFSENVLKLVQGDGSGMAPVLKSIDKLSSWAKDREALILVLIDNLNEISEQIGGRSAQVGELLTVLNGSISRFSERVDQIVGALGNADRALGPGVELLEMMVGSYDSNYAPLDALLHRVVPFTPQIVEVLGMIPGLISGLNKSVPVAGAAPADLTCSRGKLDMPVLGDLMIGSRDLVMCK